MVAFGKVRRVVGRGSVEPSREFEIAVLLVEMGGHGVTPGNRPIDLGERGEPGGGAIGFAHGYRPVEPDDRRIGEPQ